MRSKPNQNIFISYLQKGNKILDLGCGVGRDSKMFLQNGFDVNSINGSSELCKIASKNIGKPVKQMLFQDLTEASIYDGIWACASLLHLSLDELKTVLPKICKALKEDGIFYCSFKYGTSELIRNGRFYLDMNEENFQNLIEEVKLFQIEKIWISNDVRKGRKHEKWLNCIVRKENVIYLIAFKNSNHIWLLFLFKKAIHLV